MNTKILIIFAVVTMILLALGWKLSDIVRNDSNTYTQKILDQQDYESTVLPFRRGNIIDRNGTILAASEQVYNLIIDAKVILANKENRYKDATIDALVSCFGYDRADLENVFETKANLNYVIYDKQLSYEQMQAFLDLQKSMNEEFAKGKVAKEVHGIWFEEQYKRTYPYNTLASHLLGFSNSNGTEATTGGLEQQYDSILTGVNGREYGYLNADLVLERVTVPAQNGNSIMSTIDVNIQNIVEKNINKFMETYGSENISVIAMNPNNGEILAMASNRAFDLNNPRDLTPFVDAEKLAALNPEEVSAELYNVWRNYSINDDYEPGSTVKIFTIATGLEEGVLTGNETYVCNGVKSVGGWDIKCNNVYGHGSLNLTESIMRSCNVALMDIGEQIGKTRFTNYQKIFGFGQKTGIDLPYEKKGILKAVDTMGASDLATNAFGQNYTVTMVQVAAAYASIINGGSYYEPHVVKKILDEDGALVRNIEPILVRETVSKSTSEFIKNALFQTVEAGTGDHAYIEGYEIAGKTGTAQKIPRPDKNYLVSFCGFAPYDNPEILLYVIVDTPHVEDQPHSYYATDIFHDIMAEILPYVNVFPKTQVNVTQPESSAQETGENTNVEETAVPTERATDEVIETLEGSADLPESIIRTEE